MGVEEERLVIKQLSKFGELLDCVNCFPGKITVLRAEVESDLVPYRQALAGHVSGQKIVLSYNHKPFDPHEHCLVGFGSFLDSTKTVNHIFKEYGLLDQQVPAVLGAFGLNECGDLVLSKLSADERRRIEILSAVYSQARVIILDNPFEPISIVWKEKFAVLLSEDAALKKRIVIISRLCFRPTPWINNPAVERIQVGASVQKTIGFGSKSQEVNRLVAELRASGSFEHLNPEPQISENIVAPEVSPVRSTNRVDKLISVIAPQFKRYSELSPKKKLITTLGSCLTAVILVFLVFGGKDNSRSVSPIKSVSNAPILSEKNEVTKIEDTKKSVPDVAKQPQVAEVPVVKLEEKITLPPKHIEKAPNSPPSALDSFEPRIKSAVLEAFNAKETETKVTRASTRQLASKQADQNSPFEALRLLKSSEDNDISNSGISESGSSQTFEMDPSIKERQEEIRRRFLEALQRASDQDQ